jgi:hypothetical protein
MRLASNVRLWWKVDIAASRLPATVVGVSNDILIDGMLSGTGLRDAVNGGYLRADALGLSSSLASQVADWQRRYEGAHFDSFPGQLVASLDEGGLSLLPRIKNELPHKNVGYFSSAKMKRLA